MANLLITGFDPFGGGTVNPSWEAVRSLPDRIGPFVLTKVKLPVVFGLAGETALEAAERCHPDVILSVGQAGGRGAVTAEAVAINLREARIPDNAGFQPEAVPVVPGGPAAYFSTADVRAMVRSIQEAGLPGGLSYSAGAFVCNDLLYTLLHACAGTATQVGFIHVPFLPEQGSPNLSLAEIKKALTLAIQSLTGSR